MREIDKFPVMNIKHLCKWSILKEVKPNFPLLKCKLCIVTSFQRHSMWGGREDDFTEKSGKDHLSQVVKVKINYDMLTCHSVYP